MCSQKKNSWVVPFGGNGFVENYSETDPTASQITPCGLSNWISSSSNISLFFHAQYPGKVLLALRLFLPDGSSRIKFTVGQTKNKLLYQEVILNESREVDIRGNKDFQLVNCGMFTIPVAGYVKVELQGIEKTGTTYSSVSHLLVLSESHSLLEHTTLRFVDKPDDFYFGRRGPSVHIRYPLPESPDIEYFYNEIYVPSGKDVIGAYFCAMGFSSGYFGIQVNSETERRVLFSIWSEYDTGDPSEIPEEYKVKLIRKGEDVYVGEFGNEGAGAQSYLQYMWQPEETYKFIVQAKPIDSERTMFTAWFGIGADSDPASWQLIASFDKPKVSTFFKGPYSFSENFVPEMGYIERHCLFANQWSCDVNGTWTERTQVEFTADATARAETRMDISGGVGINGDETKFFLRNCGFFSDRVEPDLEFNRTSSGLPPPVDLSLLP